MKVSVSQFKSVPEVAANLATVRAHMRLAAEDGSRVIAFPEASMVAFEGDRDTLRSAAQLHAASFIAGIAEEAVASGIDAFVGIYEPNGEQRSSNVFVHVSSKGEVAGRYEKVHLYDAFSFQESAKNRHAPLKPGFEEVYVADIDGIKFGVLNCYDLRFPEIARVAVDKGADVLVYGAGWIAGSLKELHWESLLRARAIENTCFVLASCQPPPESVGMSMILDANGLALAGIARRDGVCTASIDLPRLEEVREVLPCLQHRRYRIEQA